MQIFLDTNIILDFLTARSPFDKNALEIFQLSAEKKLTIHISALSYGQIGYFLEKQLGKTNARLRLNDLFNLTKVIEVNEQIIRNAIQSDIPDFEDAIQHECALHIKNLTSLITRDLKHFKKSAVLVQTPKEFLDTYNY
ncbi:MAG: PIN domain-containing protein [Chitinophagaceae bacterium]|nr:PIN domain-containing protein [Chitinophagaceae bacterium]